MNAEDRWLTDEEFGREFLSGMNPVLICQLKEPLEKMPVTDDDVRGLLDREKSLAEEIKVSVPEILAWITAVLI